MIEILKEINDEIVSEISATFVYFFKAKIAHENTPRQVIYSFVVEALTPLG